MKIPTRKKGRQSIAAKKTYENSVIKFYAELKLINEKLPFKVSSRGWCYILEEHGLLKGQFKAAQDLINDGRKAGQLPINFTAQDGSRAFSCVQLTDETTPAEEASYIIERALLAHDVYSPLKFWDYQNYYVELIVEKVDLKSLFQDQCKEFNIPVANAKGWSDINLRAEMIDRFSYWEAKGKIPVLLYCGDHDPAGINISNLIKKNLNDLSAATGWTADNLIIDRFGLNYDFIQANNLTWIDNLETGAGRNLASPKHPDHFKPWVQDYIKAYGERKCEANALVVHIEIGRELLKCTLDKYLSYEAINRFNADTKIEREDVRLKVGELMRAA